MDLGRSVVFQGGKENANFEKFIQEIRQPYFFFLEKQNL